MPVSRFFRTSALTGYIGALATLAVLLFAAIAVHSSPLTPSIPKIQLTFTPAAFNAILTEWTPAGVDRFKAHFLLDYPFLVTYGAWGFLVATKTGLLAKVRPVTRTLLAFMLPAAALTDATENTLHLFFLFNNESIHPALYFVAGSVASVKWLLIVGFLVIGCIKAASSK